MQDLFIHLTNYAVQKKKKPRAKGERELDEDELDEDEEPMEEVAACPDSILGCRARASFFGPASWPPQVEDSTPARSCSAQPHALTARRLSQGNNLSMDELSAFMAEERPGEGDSDDIMARIREIIITVFQAPSPPFLPLHTGSLRSAAAAAPSWGARRVGTRRDPWPPRPRGAQRRRGQSSS
jgi:hypothetical protein